MPFFICPRCKTRRVDEDGHEGLSQQPPSCHHCDFGFMFELLEDYYPAPATGLVVCDQEGRILATRARHLRAERLRGARADGPPRRRGLQLSDTKPLELVREWGVRQLGKPLTMKTHAGLEKNVVADFFPAYDDDGGMLVALTP